MRSGLLIAEFIRTRRARALARRLEVVCDLLVTIAAGDKKKTTVSKVKEATESQLTVTLNEEC